VPVPWLRDFALNQLKCRTRPWYLHDSHFHQFPPIA
jgi:hypothetical protein